MMTTNDDHLPADDQRGYVVDDDDEPAAIAELRRRVARTPDETIDDRGPDEAAKVAAAKSKPPAPPELHVGPDGTWRHERVEPYPAEWLEPGSELRKSLEWYNPPEAPVRRLLATLDQLLEDLADVQQWDELNALVRAFGVIPR
jgi:hypothetical protein